MFEPMITVQSCLIEQVTSYKETVVKLGQRWEGEYTVFIITLLCQNVSSSYGIMPKQLYNSARQVTQLFTQETFKIIYTRSLGDLYSKQVVK